MPQNSTGQNSLGLSVYLGMAKYAEQLTEGRLKKDTSLGGADPVRIAERYGKSSVERPHGQLIWLHAANLAQSLPLIELIGRISAVRPSLRFVLTTTDPVPQDIMSARLPKGAVHQYAPYDSPRAAETFLNHWRPDLCLWSENRLMPVLIKEAARRKGPLIFVNAELSIRNFRRLRWMPGVAAAVLNSFAAILSVDQAAADSFRRLGANHDKITVVGALTEGSAALPHDEAERARISNQLHGRPVWLAAHIAVDEIETVLKAHKLASRVTHRLLTILSPQTARDASALARLLTENGLNFAVRSQMESLNALTEVILADVPGELGLWYRIGSVSFIGNSLCRGGGQNPFEPAALGSAIVHGPHVDKFADSYFRLAQAGAAVEVSSAESLAEAISVLSSPDKAAEMAHAAWQITSQGAEVTDRIMETIIGNLPHSGAAA